MTQDQIWENAFLLARGFYEDEKDLRLDKNVVHSLFSYLRQHPKDDVIAYLDLVKRYHKVLERSNQTSRYYEEACSILKDCYNKYGEDAFLQIVGWALRLWEYLRSKSKLGHVYEGPLSFKRIMGEEKAGTSGSVPAKPKLDQETLEKLQNLQEPVEGRVVKIRGSDVLLSVPGGGQCAVRLKHFKKKLKLKPGDIKVGQTYNVFITPSKMKSGYPEAELIV